MPRTPPRPPRRRPPPLTAWRAAADELIAEIVTAAERLARARDDFGRRVVVADPQLRLLNVLERSRYCLAIADVARALVVRRQRAHELVQEANRAGYVELRPNVDDRRILQVFLTAAGRAELRRLRLAGSMWQNVLLNGLQEHDMAIAIRVIRVIRQRLERDVRERTR